MMKTPFWQSFRGDKVIWRIIIILSLISLLAIYSSTSSLAFRHGQTPLFYLVKQFIFTGVSIAVVYIVHNIPIFWYRRLAKLVFYTSIILLLVLFMIGGLRWLNVFGVTFQPSEVAKIGMVLYVAKILEEGDIETFKKYCLRILVPIGIMSVLIMLGSNTAALLSGGVVLMILWIDGIRRSHLWKTILIAVVSLGAIVFVADATGLFRIETLLERIELFFGIGEGRSDSHQVHQAEIAVSTGGIIGKGPGNSTQRHTLPEGYSDYVFAIIIEEYGVIGAFVVLFMYLILLYRAVAIAKSCTKIFPMITVLGLTSLIVFQAIIHMSVAVGIFPVTGQTLPFISLGGSSLITTGFAMGIILSISRATEEQNLPKTRPVQNETLDAIPAT